MSYSVQTDEELAAACRADSKCKSVGAYIQKVRATEGSVEHCTAGACSTKNNLKSETLKSIPGSEGALSLGMRKTLTNLYGTCAAKDPLNMIYTPSNPYLQHYRDNLTGSKNDPDKALLHIPGISQAAIDKGYDNVRSINKKVSPFGPYTQQARGARTCTNKVKVGSEYITPAKVHKMFGNGASGMMMDGKFSIFSCGSQKYINRYKGAARAYKCGLSPGSKVTDHKASVPGLTIDCAELIGAAAIASCKKLHPKQTFGKEKNIRLNGRFLATRSLKQNACLKIPNISPAHPISSGDVFVLGGHAIMINKVGSDPFGIQRAGNDCRRINSNSFNFSFSHSSSFKEMGPVHSTARAYNKLVYDSGYGADHFPLSELVIMARQMCNENKKGRGVGPSSRFLRKPVNGKSVRQLRHQSKNPKCSYPKGKCPKVAGSECAGSCGVK